MALKYKSFTWPNDPHTYREVLSREPLYTTSGGVMIAATINTRTMITRRPFFNHSGFKKPICVNRMVTTGISNTMPIIANIFIMNPR